MHAYLRNEVVTYILLKPIAYIWTHLGVCTFLLFVSANSINVDVGGRSL